MHEMVACHKEMKRRCLVCSYHLVSQHQDSLQREFPAAITKQVLQTRPQQINDENILFPVHATPLDVSNATWTPKPFPRKLAISYLYYIQVNCCKECRGGAYFLLGGCCRSWPRRTTGDASSCCSPVREVAKVSSSDA